MQRHTSNIYRKNFYLPFNAFVNIKIGLLYKAMHHHTVRTSYKIFYKKDFFFNSRFIKTHEWSSSSPDFNPLDYYFWNKVKEKVYENRLNKPFENKRELKKWIESVWKDITFSLPEIRRAIKQFAGRLKAVKERKDQCIKMIYG